MTFTYSFTPATDLTRCRFHTGDTDATATIWQDEEINFVLAEIGTYQYAVIYLIQSLIANLSQERDISADWLKVSPGTALETMKMLLVEKRRLFGITSIVGKAITPYRPDSGESSSPDYTNLESNYSAFGLDNSSLGGYGY